MTATLVIKNRIRTYVKTNKKFYLKSCLISELNELSDYKRWKTILHITYIFFKMNFFLSSMVHRATKTINFQLSWTDVLSIFQLGNPLRQHFFFEFAAMGLINIYNVYSIPLGRKNAKFDRKSLRFLKFTTWWPLQFYSALKQHFHITFFIDYRSSCKTFQVCSFSRKNFRFFFFNLRFSLNIVSSFVSVPVDLSINWIDQESATQPIKAILQNNTS